MAEPRLIRERESAAVSSPPAARDDGIDPEWLARVVWRHRRLVGLVVVAGALTGAALTLLVPRRYQATATLAVGVSKLSAEGQAGVSAATVRPLIDSPALAQRMVAEFKLAGPPHRLTPSLFLRRALAVEEVRGTPLLRVSVTLRDPSLVARVATRVAEEAQTSARTLTQREALEARDVIKRQLDEARAHVERADAAVRTYREQAQMELLRKDIEARLEQRADLLRLDVSLEAERARLTQAEREVSGRPRVETVTRAFDDEPAAAEAARQQSLKGTDLMGLQLRTEVLNGVHQEMDGLVAKTRTSVAAMERQRSQLLGVRGLSGDRLGDLAELYRRESGLRRLELEYELAKGAYALLAARYESARVDVVARSVFLQVIDPPVSPDQSMSRPFGRNTAFGGFVGLLVAVCWLLLRSLRRGGQTRG